jgi:hypothetical protein
MIGSPLLAVSRAPRPSVGLDDSQHPVPPLRGVRLLATWSAVVTLGECAGFAVPAVTGALTADLAEAAAIPLVVAAGAVEGALLGGTQAAVLGRALPSVRRRRWTVLTAVAAVAAYGLGFAASVAGSTLSVGPAVATAVVAGSLLLLTLGSAQWLELRGHVPRAGRWIGWTAFGWLVALGAFLAIATPLWHAGQAVGTATAIGVGAGLAMACTQAAVTGWGLVRLTDDLDRRGGWSR